MLSLSDTHPDAYQQMVREEFSVQRSSTNTFGQVGIHQATEQSLNCDTKSTGGIVGISKNPGGVLHWVLTAHLRAEFLHCLKEIVGLNAEADAVHVHKKCKNFVSKV